MKVDNLNDIPSVADYLRRIDAEPRSLRVAIVKQMLGQYWTEIVKVTFTRQGEVTATIGYEPTEAELALIKADFAKIDWPKWCPASDLSKAPSAVKDADPEKVFVFKDERNEKILMVQVRVDLPDGKKVYVPYSYFEDGVWRKSEPEMDNGLLPLYGLHTLKGNTTCFISEGSKAARAVERIINPKTEAERKVAEEFPWSKEFKYAASVGFVGGALAVQRTDWLALKRAGIERAIIIADNDTPGVDAVPKISELIDIPANALIFDEQWPKAWDMADPWPEKMFKTINGKRYYVGPNYFDVIRPATFMTKQTKIVDEKGKEILVPVLRQHAKNQWFYAERQKKFVNVEFPTLEVDKEGLDELLSNFSNTPKTSKLLLKEFASRVWKLAYRPDMDGQKRVLIDGEMAVNLFRGTPINPREGDPKPFLDFINHLVPDKKEAHELLRWIATLIARPDIRMLYGVLLISQQTGLGKTLLCESIVAPLVGIHNVSFPSEETVLEVYTSWIAKKRLCVIGEIYQGHSFKMANKLKQYITDTKITLREMYESVATLDNFAHFLASSNSISALKFDSNERRWFVPKMNENRLPDEKYEELVNWLASGGLSIIYYWAENFGDYVKRGERAPMTSRKQEMIQNSRSEAALRCEDLSRLMMEADKPIAIGDKEIKAWLMAVCKEKVYESALAIRKEVKSQGVIEITKEDIGGDGRISFNSQMQNVMVNKKAFDILHGIEDIDERRAKVRDWLVRPASLMKYED